MEGDTEEGEEDNEDLDEDYSDSDDETCDIEEQEEKKNLKRKVSFKGEKDNSENYQKSDTCDDNPIRIVFKHSDTPSSVPLDTNGEISTPSDIYLQYSILKRPKSILKPTSVNHPLVNFEVEKDVPVVTSSKAEVSVPLLPVEPAVKVIFHKLLN